MASNIQGKDGEESPWERRHKSAFEGLRIPFGAAIRFAPPKSLAKRLLKFGPNAVPGIFLGWHMHPGGVWKGEYLVAYWPDFQELGIQAKRIAVHTVQEVILDELPVSDADAPKLVGGWRFPLAQVLDEPNVVSSAFSPTQCRRGQSFG